MLCRFPLNRMDAGTGVLFLKLLDGEAGGVHATLVARVFYKTR